MGVVYEYQCLPFGYSLAPRTFSKCVETALGPPRRQGKRVLFYLDDLLILSDSEEAARRDTMTVINHLSFLGFCHQLGEELPAPRAADSLLGALPRLSNHDCDAIAVMETVRPLRAGPP